MRALDLRHLKKTDAEARGIALIASVCLRPGSGLEHETKSGTGFSEISLKQEDRDDDSTKTRFYLPEKKTSRKV